MADLSCNIAGVRSPNPFWLASAPPTDKLINVQRAFEAGWGGVVWKTLGEAGPPVVNVCSRYGSIDYNGQRMIGLNNIELITDRPLEINLEEITAVKKAWPDRAMVVSLMVPCNEKAWREIMKRGEQVARGELIAQVGETGVATAPHLHYEVIVDGKPRNPLNFVFANVIP